MPSISLQRATLVALVVEGITYGLFLSLWFTSAFILIRRRRKKDMNLTTPMLLVLASMILFATSHIAVDIQRALNAFLRPDRSPIAYLGVLKDPLYTAKNTIFIAQVLLGDGFLLYRLLLVWNRNLYIFVPIFLCYLASISQGICELVFIAKAADKPEVFVPQIRHWIIAFVSLAFTTNFLSTCFIAGRIWWGHRRSAALGRVGGPNLAAPLVLVIESAAIYSCWLLMELILYASGSYAHYIFLDSLANIVGFVFSLVIVRVGLGLSAYGPRPTTTLDTPNFFDPGTHEPMSTGSVKHKPFHLKRGRNTVGTVTSTDLESSRSTDHGIPLRSFDIKSPDQHEG